MQLIPDGILCRVAGVIVQDVRAQTIDKQTKLPLPVPRYSGNLAYMGGKKYVGMSEEAFVVLQQSSQLAKMPQHDLVGVLTEETFGGKTFTKFAILAAVRTAPGAGEALLAALMKRQKEEERAALGIDQGGLDTSVPAGRPGGVARPGQ